MINISKIFYPKNDCNLIRLGNENDGGYIVEENSVRSSEILISFGLSDDWSFESDFSKLGEKKIYTYDYSVNLRFWIVNFIKSLINIFLLREPLNNIKKLKEFYNYKFFFDKKNNFHYKKFISPKSMRKNMLNNNFITDLDNNLQNLEKNFFLKIDIEGSEYRILDQIIKNSKKINGLAIEFHDFDLHQNVIKKFVNELDLKLVHIHVNNYGTINSDGIPSTIEFTFSSKEFISNDLNNDKVYPVVNLDKPCNKNEIDHKVIFN